MPIRWLHWLPVGLYLFLSFLYMVTIPTGESPDEPGHIQCIEQVAVQGRLPRVEPVPEGERWFSRGRIISGKMCYHMPLYYLLAGGVVAGTAVLTNTPLPYEFSASNPQFPGQSAAMFVRETAVRSAPITVLRFLSVLLGLATLWATHRLTVRLFPEQAMVGVLAMMLVAGWPQVLFLSRAINNDVLATMLSVMLLAVLVDVDKPRRFVTAGVLSALAVLTKLTVFFTVGVVAIVWLVEFTNSPQLRSTYWRVLAVCLVLWLGVALLLWLHPLLRVHFLSGTSSLTSLPERARTMGYWLDVGQQTLSSGWARFGWMNVPAPNWQAYVWWGVIGITAVLGLRHLKMKPSLWLLLFVWLMGVGLTYIRINMTIFQPQFRFILSLLPIVVALSAGGWWHLNQSNVYRRLLMLFLPVFLLFYNVWLLLFVIKPVYQ